MSCTIFLFHMVYGHGFRCGFMLTTDLFFSSFEGNRCMMIFSSSGHKNEGFSESFTDGRFVVEIQLVTQEAKDNNYAALAVMRCITVTNVQLSQTEWQLQTFLFYCNDFPQEKLHEEQLKNKNMLVMKMLFLNVLWTFKNVFSFLFFFFLKYIFLVM